MGATAALSIAALVCLIGMILAAIAFGTNSWQRYDVDRNGMLGVKPEWASRTEDVFFTRTFGFFRECFIGETIPGRPDIYQSPLGYKCVNIKYDNEIKDGTTDVMKEYIHLKKTYLAFYVVGLTLSFIGILILIAACGKRSANMVIISGVVIFLAGAFIAASVGIWHRVWYIIENELLFTPEATHYDPMIAEAKKGAPRELIEYTTPSYYWSLVLAWISVALLLLGGILMCAAAGISKKEKDLRDDETDRIHVLYPPGQGLGSGVGYDKQHATATAAAAHANSYGMMPYGYSYDYNTYNNAYAYYPYAYYGPYSYGYGYNTVTR